jgi:hypothetical protein
MARVRFSVPPYRLEYSTLDGLYEIVTLFFQMLTFL